MYSLFFGSGAPLSFNKLLKDYNQKGSRNFWEGHSFTCKYKQTPSGFFLTPLYYLIWGCFFGVFLCVCVYDI